MKLGLLYYLPIMENHMEKNMENEMDSGGNRVKDLDLGYYIGETI